MALHVYAGFEVSLDFTWSLYFWFQRLKLNKIPRNSLIDKKLWILSVLSTWLHFMPLISAVLNLTLLWLTFHSPVRLFLVKHKVVLDILWRCSSSLRSHKMNDPLLISIIMIMFCWMLCEGTGRDQAVGDGGGVGQHHQLRPVPQGGHQGDQDDHPPKLQQWRPL